MFEFLIYIVVLKCFPIILIILVIAGIIYGRNN